jgi:hypothetical protein
MSGPIVRKYGFPNFDDIFGKRELEHGVDESDAATTTPTEETPSKAKDGGSGTQAKGAPKGKKKA